MSRKLKAEVRINDVEWDSDITLGITDAEAAKALEVLISGEQLNLSLMTGRVNGKVEDPKAYAQ